MVEKSGCPHTISSISHMCDILTTEYILLHYLYYLYELAYFSLSTAVDGTKSRDHSSLGFLRDFEAVYGLVYNYILYSIA